MNEMETKSWFEQTVVALNDNGFDLGTWAAKIIDMVKNNKDGARGSLEQAAPAAVQVDEAKTTEPDVKGKADEHAACGCEAKTETTEKERKVIPIQVARDQREEAEREGAAAEGGEELTVEYASGANPNQRRPAGNEIRAGSNLLAPEVLPELESLIFVIHHGEAFYGVAREHIEAFRLQAGSTMGEIKNLRASDLKILSVRNNLSALPELIASMQGYNLIRMDSIYFGVPVALGELDLTTDDIAGLPGVIVDKSYKLVEDRIKEITANQGLYSSVRSAFAGATQSGTREMPHMATSIDGYNLYYYQGRYYGLLASADTMNWDEQDLRRVRGTIKEGSLGALKAEIKKRAGSQTLMTA